MFYKGLEPGVILYRKTRSEGIEISEIKEYHKVDVGRRYELYPIIGNWKSQTVIHTENTECSRWRVPFKDLIWYCWGTNFKKVYESNVI